MAESFTNFAKTNLTNTINSTNLSIVLDDASNFPTANFYIVVDCDNAAHEIILVASRSGNTLTVSGTGQRGQDGTTAVAHNKGASIIHTVLAHHANLTNYHATRCTRSTAKSITTATWTAIDFNTEDWDTDNWHTTGGSNTTVTPTIAGYYVCKMLTAWDGSSSGARYCAVAKNGTRIRQYPGPDPGTAGIYTLYYEEAVLMNGTTDYLEMYVYQDSGGNLNWRNGEGWFEVQFVGY